jgi:subtilisin family serine protease
MSLGSDESSDADAEGFRRLTDEGVLCIAAAGNDGASRLLYPAALPDVIAVGAVDNSRTLAPFSNTSPMLGVVAPGVSVLSTLPMGSALHIVATTPDGSALTSATLVDASAYAELSGNWVYCQYGGAGDFPAEVRGKIAVVTRGMNLPFATKVRNAVAAGATGVVIIDNAVEGSRMSWTLIETNCDSAGCHPVPEDVSYQWPLVLGVSYFDGAKLLGGGTKSIAIGAWRDDYGSLSGTSMATPHVSGVAALVWSLAPSATARQVSNALRASARDLGDAGFDPLYGHGLIDAHAAAEWVAPGRFGLPAAPAAKPHAAH